MESSNKKKKSKQNKRESNEYIHNNTDIAIIGMACRFPGANNYCEFWENLEKGINSITEIPADRWDWKEYFGDPQKSPNKTNSKWGGFIKDVDKFDTAFFNISPREAESMDPQQRIMLELTWSCLEDAGYPSDFLQGRYIGVYIGACNPDYKEFIDRKNYLFPQHYLTGVGDPLIANRISYLFDFNGPSLVVDTACSSALVALNNAVQSLHSGDCEMAFVGGINLLLHGERYISFSNLGMLSSTGQCHAFDEKADGYVRGEGAGIILLKPLQKAIADNNHIHAIIKGSSINHGGKARTITSPNFNMQAQVIYRSWKQANIEPNKISYIEAHGTGTPLGDPIEIHGLQKAFKNLAKDFDLSLLQNYCGIGTVKTNIGHLEAAAGIAGLIKVILAMQHKKLPALQNFETQNSRINLAESPFYLLDKLTEWKNAKNTPRYAGVSSFGFGGTNAHVVIEEGPDYVISSKQHKPYYLLALSAKHPDSLKQKIEDLSTHLENHINLPIEAIAYTLNAGRSHFDYRCALAVTSTEELQEKLGQIQKQQKPNGYLEGNTRQKPDDEAIYRQVLEESLEKLKNLDKNETRKYKELIETLANLYVKGYGIDWQLLHQGEVHQKISLPTYPFLKERYWIDQEEAGISASRNVDGAVVSSLHPLLDANTSTLEYQSFTKTFSGHEFYLSDHQVNGVPTLPGVAYLEMARVAGEIAMPGKKIIGISNIVWAQPIQITDQTNKGEKQSHLFLCSTESGIEFEVVTETGTDDPQKTLHVQGKIIYGEGKHLQEMVELETIKGRCSSHEEQEEIYKRLKKFGLSYGPSFQSIKEVFYNKDEVLAKLQLPNHFLADEADKFALHPSILDGALQATIALASAQSSLSLPFSLGELEIIGPLPSCCYAYVKLEQESLPKFQIQILDEHGKVRINLKDFVVRPFVSSFSSESGVYRYHPLWKESKIVHFQNFSSVVGPILVINEREGLIRKLHSHLHTQTILQAKFGENFEREEKSYIFDPNNVEDYRKLFNNFNAQGCLPRHIIYHAQLQNEIDLEYQTQQCYKYLLYLSQVLIQQTPKEVIEILYINEGPQLIRSLLSEAISGFAKSLGQEHHRLTCRVIEIGEVQDKASLILQEFGQLETEVRYDEEQKRWVKTYEEVAHSNNTSTLSLKKNGVYLITGGAGGLGLIFAKYLAEYTQGKLILTGRSKLKAKQKDAIRELEQLGAEISYFQTDVTQRSEVENLIQKIKGQFGSLNGVIHSAGVIRDGLILKKDYEEAEAVLWPKIKGALYLDEMVQSELLDFFVLFSSVTSVFGNVGQSDYAYANGFMDGFATRREALRKAKQRHGKTVSINWPLWADGGMQIDKSSLQWMEQTFGASPLSVEEGLQVFGDVLSHDAPQQVILKGQKKKLLRTLEMSLSLQALEKPSLVLQPTIDNPLLFANLQNQVIAIISKVLKIKVKDIDVNKEISTYGIDSIAMTTFITQINRTYELELTPAVLFENNKLILFLRYLLLNHSNEILHHLQKQNNNSSTLQKNREHNSIYTIREKKLAFSNDSSLKTNENFDNIDNLLIRYINNEIDIDRALDAIIGM